jgi:tetratricopeptide (TPR) repeat protein
VLQAAKLRLEGEKLVELGQPEKGQEKLQRGAEIGGPAEWLSLARYQARHGDLDDAQQSTQKAIDMIIEGSASLYSPQAAEAFAEQAGILRRKGDPNAAIGRLERALSLVGEVSPDAVRVKARLLDDLGLARKASGNIAGARRDFEEAAELRKTSGTPEEECQSLVNLVRLDVSEGKYDSAAVGVDRVELLIPRVPASSLQANASVLVAQIRLRQKRAGEGIEFAKRAIALNRQIANRRGEAISLLLLAQSHRAVSQFDEAREVSQECLRVNGAINDSYGEGRAQYLLDNLPTS